MPRLYREMVLSASTPLEHDAGGKLLAMHIKAEAIVFGAQFLRPPIPCNPMYREKIMDAVEIVVRERNGWRAIKTDGFPCGDLEGAGKASLKISSFFMELDECKNALRWCMQAVRDFRACNSVHSEVTGANMDFILMHMQLDMQNDFLQSAFGQWHSQTQRHDLQFELLDVCNTQELSVPSF